jgi:prevent-host-death family protein
MGSTMTPMTAAVMNAVGAERAGLGSAMTNTAREVGGVFGIALLGTLLTTRLKGVLPDLLANVGLAAPAEAAIVASAGHGRVDPSLLAGLQPAQAAGVQSAFQESFLSGFHLALLVAGCLLLAAAIVANRFIPSGAPARVEVGRDHAVAPVQSDGRGNGYSEIATTELRTKTAEILKRASDGESFVVTSRGVPVASIGPPPEETA